MYNNMSVAVVIPALNEEQSIGMVVRELRSLRNADTTMVVDDLVVCDNGSSDTTAQRARDAGARVVHEQQAGYGNACLAAIATLQGPDIIVFIDGDHAFDAAQVTNLLDCIAAGADLAIGSRTLGRPARGALSPGQALGNRIICALIRLLWGQRVTDLGPYRAIRFDAFTGLNMAGYTLRLDRGDAGQGDAAGPGNRRGAGGYAGTHRQVQDQRHPAGRSQGQFTGILCMIAKLRWQQYCQYRYR